MSVYSDYKCGALSYEDYKRECAHINEEDRYYHEHDDGCVDEYENEEDDDER